MHSQVTCGCTTRYTTRAARRYCCCTAACSTSTSGSANCYPGDSTTRQPPRKPPETRSSTGLDNISRDGAGGGRRYRILSITERVLLYGYWAVSGYGLRAWRATTILVVMVATAALLFSSQLGLATTKSPERLRSINPNNGEVAYVDASSPPPGFPAALNFLRAKVFRSFTPTARLWRPKASVP